MAVFSSSAVSHSLLLRNRWSTEQFSIHLTINSAQTISSVLITFFVLFLFSLQLRIVCEIRDYELPHPRQFPHPVIKGLVTLQELGIVAIGCGIIQLGLTLALKSALVLILFLVWSYLFFMSQNFFVPSGFTINPLLYRAAHTLIMPLMGLYATACDWFIVDYSPPKGLLWFLLVSFFGGMAIEIGRKIRAPKDEIRGLETYTTLWGRKNAVMAWLGITWLTTLTTLLAGMYIEFTVPVALLLLVLLTYAVIVAWQFLSYPVRQWARRFELVSGSWIIIAYLILGIIPLLLQGVV